MSDQKIQKRKLNADKRKVRRKEITFLDGE